MESLAKRKKREPPYQAVEKELLVDLVEQNYGVVENKKTDTVSSKSKIERWKEIADQFNAASSVYLREWLVLRTLWENMKKKAKAIIALQHDNLYETGGGRAKTVLQDPIITRVIGLIRPQVEPLENEYDDDHIENEISSRSKEHDIAEVQDERHELMEKTTANNWSHYNPGMLKAPRASALRTQNQNIEAITEVFNEEVVDEKLDVLELSSISKAKLTNQTPSRTVGIDSSRRRPVLKRPQAEALVEAKLATLNSATQEATKEHEISLHILELKREQEKVKLEIEKEKLIQEKLKTEHLKIELDKKIGVAWEYEPSNNII